MGGSGGVSSASRRADITWLTDDLATGGDFAYSAPDAAAQLADLRAQGVGMVIDCRIEDDDAAAWAPFDDVEYIHLGQRDYHGNRLPASHFDRAVELARAAHASGRKVFVHCHMGINRGPSTAFAILLDRGWQPWDAFDLIRERRPISAVYYATDALAADLARKEITGVMANTIMSQFISHRNAVYGERELAQTQHIIRQTHIARGDWA